MEKLNFIKVSIVHDDSTSIVFVPINAIASITEVYGSEMNEFKVNLVEGYDFNVSFLDKKSKDYRIKISKDEIKLFGL
jgi:hypothetical protein